jgi:RNA polymerase sigma-70 factor (ECF subfamily)
MNFKSTPSMSSDAVAASSSAQAMARACERLDLERLIKRMADAEQAALTEFHKLMADRLFSMAHRMLDDHSAAADALQDCLVRVWRTAGRFDPGRGDAFTWVAMLLRGICLDQLRSRSRRHRRTDVATQLLQDNAPGELEDLFFRETVQLVRQALSALERNEREVLETALFSPESSTEAASRMSLSPGNLKVRTHRAMQRLRSLLGEHFPRSQ